MWINEVDSAKNVVVKFDSGAKKIQNSKCLIQKKLRAPSGSYPRIPQEVLNGRAKSHHLTADSWMED